MEDLEKSSSYDTGRTVYLFSLSKNDNLKCTVNGYQSILWDDIIRLQDYISSRVGQRES